MCVVASRFGANPMTVADTWPMPVVWACQAWAIENDPWGSAELAGEGYVGREIQRRMRNE